MDYKIFRNENMQNEIFGLRIGRVIRVKQQVGEDVDSKRLVCDIEIAMGGTKNDVPFFGGGIDTVTENPHGIFVPPREDQMVGVLFVRGHYDNPIAAFSIPHPSWNVEQADLSKFNELLDSINDIAVFHYTGTKIIMRENGKIELLKDISGTDYGLTFTFSDTDKKTTIEDQNSNKIILQDGKIVIESSGDIELGTSSLEKLVKGLAMQTLYNSHTHPSAVGPTGAPIQQMSSSQLSSKNYTE